MKKYSYVVLLMMFSISLNAQSLRVIYKATQDIQKISEQIKDPAIRQMVISKLNKPRYFKLEYKNGKSLFQPVVLQENYNSSVQVIGNNESVYKNFTTGELIRKKPFLQRTFIIRDSLKKWTWKITNETKKIGGYLCRKAVLNNKKIVAWFAEKIPVSDGALSYYGLPGLILELNIAGGFHFEAVEIHLNAKISEIKKPEGGKEVTRKEFDEIVKNKMNMLGGSNGQNNNVQVKIIH